ncbi:MAG: DinB family protein [Sphingobacteriales bacterium]
MIKDVILQLNEVIEEFMNSDLRSINWTLKSAPGKWSKKEIIGHLIDSAQINLQRFVRCTYEENFKLTYEQVEWVQAQHYQDADIADLIGLWELLNIQIIRVLENYPADRLKAQCDNSKTSVSLHSVEWLAQDYADHLKHHLMQVCS